jgi:glycine cleavage system transcriptional repressor
MPSHLVISAIAPNKPGIADEVIALVASSGCNILESKMKTMGETFSLVLMAEGEWNAIAKLEHSLPSRASNLGMTTMMQRTELPAALSALPYRVKIIVLDNPGIIKEITQFFAKQKISIQELSCNTFTSTGTGARIGLIKLTINISPSVSLSKVREEFQDFCAKTNLDGNIEPVTH